MPQEGEIEFKRESVEVHVGKDGKPKKAKAASDAYSIPSESLQYRQWLNNKWTNWKEVG